MITFLPLPSFKDSAKVLDNQRLGKQRAEVKQLVRGLLGYDNLKSRSHPASIMWQGFIPALLEYGLAICEEWRHRGYVDFVGAELAALPKGDIEMPPWFGIDAFHSSHRSRLVFKKPDYYRDKLGWGDSPVEPYLWPFCASEQAVQFRYGTTSGILTVPRPSLGNPWRAQSNPSNSKHVLS